METMQLVIRISIIFGAVIAGYYYSPMHAKNAVLPVIELSIPASEVPSS